MTARIGYGFLSLRNKRPLEKRSLWEDRVNVHQKLFLTESLSSHEGTRILGYFIYIHIYLQVLLIYVYTCIYIYMYI